ncbi:unnamed protein product [Diabrotica balteata]|uniref:Uncharacterized protein n=1 Tax=Diabrotica balteata TaxID=107213 RepID=A0A9N9XCI7_DIABA|nr:unnamed protein product [Diabrotica balteata]
MDNNKIKCNEGSSSCKLVRIPSRSSFSSQSPNIVDSNADLHYVNDYDDVSSTCTEVSDKNVETEVPEDVTINQHKSRKRKACPKQRKRNFRKFLTNSGQKYTNVNGNLVQARSLGPSCNPYKGNTSIRGYNHAFYLENRDQKKIKVCRRFFISTIGVTKRCIRTVIKKTESGFISNDQTVKGGKPLCGHDETKESNGKGLFLEIVQLLKKYDLTFKVCLESVLKNCTDLNNYNQNDILRSVKNVRDVQKEVKGKPLCVIADGKTSDVTHHEQIAIIFRCIPKGSTFLGVRLIAFKRLNLTDTESISKPINST